LLTTTSGIKSFRLNTSTGKKNARNISDVKQLYGPFIHYMKVDLSMKGDKKIPEKERREKANKSLY